MNAGVFVLLKRIIQAVPRGSCLSADPVICCNSSLIIRHTYQCSSVSISVHLLRPSVDRRFPRKCLVHARSIGPWKHQITHIFAPDA
jgi:hypothetical protein